MFLIQCLKNSQDNFDINNPISFASSTTSASSTNKFKHKFSCTSRSYHFYFSRVVHVWNSLATEIDFPLYPSPQGVKRHITNIHWDHFITTLAQTSRVPSTTFSLLIMFLNPSFIIRDSPFYSFTNFMLFVLQQSICHSQLAMHATHIIGGQLLQSSK